MYGGVTLPIANNYVSILLFTGLQFDVCRSPQSAGVRCYGRKVSILLFTGLQFDARPTFRL